jgi:hypothetical protein
MKTYLHFDISEAGPTEKENISGFYVLLNFNCAAFSKCFTAPETVCFVDNFYLTVLPARAIYLEQHETLATIVNVQHVQVWIVQVVKGSLNRKIICILCPSGGIFHFT